MSEIFDRYPDLTQKACDKYAEQIVRGPVRALDWQGYHSYTVESEDRCTIIQFRSVESPLEQDIVDIAKKTHPTLVPNMVYLGYLPNSMCSIWKMEKIAGVGFLNLVDDVGIQRKLLNTVADMAKLFAEAWDCAAVPTSLQANLVRAEYLHKLEQLDNNLPRAFHGYIQESRAILDQIIALPWVLTHDDLSSMNILLDPSTGHLNGVVDWADAAVRPFGIGLWGLESVLGYDSPKGWVWLSQDMKKYRKLFATSLQDRGIGLSSENCGTISAARRLGILLRYGFVWRDGAMVPVEHTTVLEMFLQQILFSAE